MVEINTILQAVKEARTTEARHKLVHTAGILWEGYVDELHHKRKGKEYTRALDRLIVVLIPLFKGSDWVVKKNVLAVIGRVIFSDAVEQHGKKLIDLTLTALLDADGRVRDPASRLLKLLLLEQPNLQVFTDAYFKLQRLIHTTKDKKIKKSLEYAAAYMQCPKLEGRIQESYPDILKFMKINRTKQTTQQDEALFQEIEKVANAWIEEGRTYAKKVDDIWLKDPRMFVPYWKNASIFQLSLEYVKILQEIPRTFETEDEFMFDVYVNILENRFMRFYRDLVDEHERQHYCVIYGDGVKIVQCSLFLDLVNGFLQKITSLFKLRVGS